MKKLVARRAEGLEMIGPKGAAFLPGSTVLIAGDGQGEDGRAGGAGARGGQVARLSLQVCVQSTGVGWENGWKAQIAQATESKEPVSGGDSSSRQDLNRRVGLGGEGPRESDAKKSRRKKKQVALGHGMDTELAVSDFYFSGMYAPGMMQGGQR